MTPIGLTKRQAVALGLITHRLNSTGISPSYDELAAHLGLRSKSGVCRVVDQLVERGHLVRLERRARGLGLPSSEAAIVAQMLERAAASAAEDGFSVRLSRPVAMLLLKRCEQTGRLPGDVIATAVARHLGGGNA